MKAIRVARAGGPEVLELVELPDPRPGPGDVLVRVRAIGVNPVETYVRAGTYGPIEAPYTPGSDAAGTVEAVGAGVHGFAAGDRVYTSGTKTGAYAELVLADEAHVHRLPAALGFAAGAAIGVPYVTAYRALFHRARAVPGEVLLVHGGSGGVGIAACQLARAAGLFVIATAGTEEGRRLVLREGAHEALDHRAPGHFAEVLARTAGRGVDVILEMLANVNLGRDLPVLAPRGRVVVIGSRGTVEIDPRDAMRRDAAILGMIRGNATREETASIHAALEAGLANGTLRPVVGREIPLALAARAHEAVYEPGAQGKIVLVP
jgi:NADPH2:quinone reductase